MAPDYQSSSTAHLLLGCNLAIKFAGMSWFFQERVKSHTARLRVVLQLPKTSQLLAAMGVCYGLSPILKVESLEPAVSESLKILSVNIERSKHLARVKAFIEQEQPDVLCIQELCQRDIEFFAALMGSSLHFAPMTRQPAEERLETVGVGIVARAPLATPSTAYYSGSAQVIPEIRFVQETDGYRAIDPQSIAEVMLAGSYRGFRIATTHLNVTREGLSTLYQHDSARRLIALADAQAQRAGGLLLTGDFNAPRGRATFDLLAEHFIDGVPAHYTSSIDGSLHRAGAIPYMVDGLFHTSSYQLLEARLHTGISDHCALSCILRHTDSSATQ